MGDGHVVHLHVAHPGVRQLRGDDVGDVLGVAVDRGVGDHHALLLGGIGAPLLILVDEPVQLLAPDGAVQRADHGDVQLLRLFQQRLHLRAVLADDVGVVAPGVIQALGLEVQLVGKDVSVQRAEGAEGVRGIQHLVGGVEGHHDLRPVDHRGHDKGEGVAACGQGVALLHQRRAAVDVEGEVVPDHRQRLGVADDPDVGVAQHQLAHRGAMVRLHVVDHQVIQAARPEQVFEVLKEHLADAPVHGVDQRGLLVQHQIGVVGDAVRDRVDVFKQRQTPVAAAHPVHILCDLFDAMHAMASLCIKVCYKLAHRYVLNCQCKATCKIDGFCLFFSIITSYSSNN